jgi:hypothetical protein
MTSTPVQEETAMSTFRIVFTDPAKPGEPAAIWSGYEDYSAARRALADADLMIPLRWTSTIEEEPDATNPDSGSPDEPEEFWCGFENYSAARHYQDEVNRASDFLDEPDEPEEFWCGFESFSAARRYLDDADDPL